MSGRFGRKTKRFPWKTLIFTGAMAALFTIAIVGWRDLYVSYLEHNAPQIEILDFPRGLGRAPVSIRMKLIDQEAGLDEVVVAIAQRNYSREILRQELNGETQTEINLTLSDKTELEEGVAQLEIRAYDRSFWSNKSILSRQLSIDYRKPKIEVLSAQHNAVQGGSQLIFYRAFDESLAVSGVKIGNRTFFGFKASGIDSDFEDPSVYVALYAIDMNERNDVVPRAFAEDEVGNAVSTEFNYRIQKRSWRDVTLKLTDDFLRDQVAKLAEANLPKLKQLTSTPADKSPYSSASGSTERLLEQFQLLNDKLRVLNEQQLLSLLPSSRFERLWDGALTEQPGSISGAYGDRIAYTYDSQLVSRGIRHGYEYTLNGESSDVLAAGNGIIMFVDNLGTLGRLVGIDHGLGLVTIYGYLGEVAVKQGESITAGQKIGTTGVSGLVRGNKLLFETRIHGVPVDAREWWDKRWYYGHITGKINEVKRVLGIPVYKPLG